MPAASPIALRPPPARRSGPRRRADQTNGPALVPAPASPEAVAALAAGSPRPTRRCRPQRSAPRWPPALASGSRVVGVQRLASTPQPPRGRAAYRRASACTSSRCCSPSNDQGSCRLLPCRAQRAQTVSDPNLAVPSDSCRCSATSSVAHPPPGSRPGPRSRAGPGSARPGPRGSAPYRGSAPPRPWSHPTAAPSTPSRTTLPIRGSAGSTARGPRPGGAPSCTASSAPFPARDRSPRPAARPLDAPPGPPRRPAAGGGHHPQDQTVDRARRRVVHLIECAVVSGSTARQRLAQGILQRRAPGR